MIRYKCFYRRPDLNSKSMDLFSRVVNDNPDIGGQSLYGAFRNGFWINEAGELVGWEDGRYWIPPSAILMLERYDDPDLDNNEKDDK